MSVVLTLNDTSFSIVDLQLELKQGLFIRHTPPQSRQSKRLLHVGKQSCETSITKLETSPSEFYNVSGLDFE